MRPLSSSQELHRLQEVKQSPVKPEEGQEMAEKIGAEGYYECSSKTKEGVREIFEAATRAALANRRICGRNRRICQIF